ncbi:MAG: thermonuclease family protein, partial [Candidatus Latescibacterota bacterium]
MLLKPFIPKNPAQPYGPEDSSFLKNLLLGEYVYVVHEAETPEFDRYGRLLDYLYRALDGLYVNLEILRKGYGRVYTQFPFQDMDLFRFYERNARECEKGLWALDVRGGGGE